MKKLLTKRRRFHIGLDLFADVHAVDEFSVLPDSKSLYCICHTNNWRFEHDVLACAFATDPSETLSSRKNHKSRGYSCKISFLS